MIEWPRREREREIEREIERVATWFGLDMIRRPTKFHGLERIVSYQRYGHYSVPNGVIFHGTHRLIEKTKKPWHNIMAMTWFTPIFQTHQVWVKMVDLLTEFCRKNLVWSMGMTCWNCRWDGLQKDSQYLTIPLKRADLFGLPLGLQFWWR